MLILALFLVVLALTLFLQARKRQQQIGLPAGRIIYSDTSAWGPVHEALYDPQLRLTGRPDYLVEQRGQVIPVEVKSSPAPSGPYDSHILQLASYCLLVERTTGTRPPYGILHYPNRTYAIDYTPQLETALLDVLDEMQRLGKRKEIDRSHQSAARCSACGYRDLCEQRIRS